MDWDGAVEFNRNILMRIVAQLFVLARIAPGEVPGYDPACGRDRWMTTLPRYVWRAALLVLVPAEAAMRRLLVVAARAMVLTPRPSRGAADWSLLVKGADGARAPSFNMFDPMKSFEDYWRPVLEPESVKPFPAALPEPRRFTPVGAVSLWRRLNALHCAITDLPKAARRYARWRARRDLALASNNLLRRGRASVLRPGFAPGHCRGPARHEVHVLLRECHGLAMEILSPFKRPLT